MNVGLNDIEPGKAPSHDLHQWKAGTTPQKSGMARPDKHAPAKEPEEPDPSRVEEARQIIRDYIDDLKELIAELRRRMH